MTEDRHDAQIRNVVAELAASAPPAPPFSRIAERLAAHPDGIRSRGSQSISWTPATHGWHGSLCPGAGSRPCVTPSLGA